MSSDIQSSSPAGVLIAKAISSAQSGDRNYAINLLEDIEREALKKSSSANNSTLKLINLIRDRYGLNHLGGEILPEDQVNGLVGPGFDVSLPGVSLVNCCRNRAENLLKALPTWLAHQAIREVIIVDWTSDESVRKILNDNGFTDKRIKVVRVEKEPRWILSYSFNLGFRLARHELILKVDADITIKPDFFEKNELLEGTFIAGDWTKAEKDQEHINGFFFLRSKDLLKIKGFNEYITTYGWDDDDIYSRLAASGLQRVCVDVKSIYHIPHDDASRLDGVGKTNNSSWSEFMGDPSFKIRANRYLAMTMPYWNMDRAFAPFKVLEQEQGLLVVERVLVDMPHYVSASMRKDAEVYAAVELLSWRLGPSAYHLERGDLEKLLSIKRLAEISKFDVDLLAHGLAEPKIIKRHSVYLEFEISKPEYDLSPLKNLLLSFVDETDIAIFVSSYGAGSQQIADEIPSIATRLTRWVRSEGLKLVDEKNITELKNLAREGSGCHIKVTDQFLAAITNSPPETASPIAVVSKRERLYIDAQHGFGNRLRAFGSAAAIAKAVDRELVVVWVPDVHCDCRFTDLFDYQGPVIESYEELPSNLKRYNYMENEEGANKGAEIVFESGQDVLARAAFVLNHAASHWESECREIRQLTPIQLIKDLVNSVSLPVDSIGVHVRMEAGKGLDNNAYDSPENWNKESHEQIHFWREKSHYSVFIKKIDSLLAAEPHKHIFLATDLPENYEVFKNTYRDKLLFLPRTIYDRSKEQIYYALADALLLSQTSHFLGSTWSSFSEAALRLSQSIKKIEMSGVDF
jgi:glycosyltransferase involved in cell wall biosynthesis